MAFAKRRVGGDGRVRFTGVYLDPKGRARSAGTFDSKRVALHEARAAEAAVESGSWIDPSNGKITFREYVENHWWPSRHLELTTKAAYRSYLDRHFLPFFGEMPMRSILPSTVQAWVTQAAAHPELSARSVVKYHVMLRSVFKRAVRDRVILHNPASETELPKVVPSRRRIVTPVEFSRLMDELPARYVAMVLTDIETGLRWGELIALRPMDVDFLRRTITVHRVIVEVSRKITGGERMVVKPYPKDDEPRSLRISGELIETLSRQVGSLGLSPEQLLFSSTGRADGNPLSRNTFRTKVWLPALNRARLGFHVKFHDLRHAHASWALAGGADLKAVMERMGHSQITTTQRYLHTLPDSDDKTLAAFSKIRDRLA